MSTLWFAAHHFARMRAILSGLGILPVLIVWCSISVLPGCGTRIEYYTDTAYAPRSAGAQVEWLDREPSRSHTEVARITVTSANLSEDTLRSTLLDRARALGADAVIPERPVTVIQRVGSPYYEAGLFSPAGAAFLLYGYGWYTPFTSNPYILTQGATDQPRIDHSLSAVAIRYDETPSDSTDRQGNQ